MSLETETFTYILKQYLKGKKDNISFILLSLRDFILEKYTYHNLNKDEIKILLKILIHGIDTYSFEKSISFYDYINLYVDISMESYKKVEYLCDFDLTADEFINSFINDLEQSVLENKIITLN